MKKWCVLVALWALVNASESDSGYSGSASENEDEVELDQELLDRFAQAVEIMEFIPTCSDRQLEGMKADSAWDPFTEFIDDETSNGFWGVSGPPIARYMFEVAWRTSVPDFDDRDRCGLAIALLWLRRPEWFVPSVSHIRELRVCLEHAQNFQITEAFTDGNLMLRVVVDLIGSAFSPQAELALRKSLPDPEFVNWKSFHESLVPGTRLRGLLEQAISDVGDEVVPISARDVAIWPEFFVSSDEPVNQFGLNAGDFVNHVFLQAALEGQGFHTLPLWYTFAEMHSEYRFDTNLVRDAKASFLTRCLSPGGDWQSVVGSMLDQLNPQAEVSSCLTIANMGRRTLSDDYVAVIGRSAPKLLSFYNCVLNRIEDGIISFSEDAVEFRSNVATLMHVLWMARGPLAFVLESTGQA